ncbi:ABC-2 type transporter [Anaeromyxobacter dehalogenans 2CP-1]|uniref:Transport permease protein n=1 Tax=Anaeromyxobacter dehalogenans (strain ATCC BAA-258 / DSM 21875 / 2CP-1) TaxID=455488 RepID=B8JEB2_ANAD2|nr:ABC transporter permease [Anaeromyxobacter dehalogenans]ACL64238.1 ABC-2 type transporter [Anaeromyxobacter dehalogenans 2CP-1]
MISLGLRTLFAKEVRRFLRVPGQTLLSPLVTTTLYFVVFGYSLGARLADVEGVPYARFIVPGLVTLGVVTNAYLNSASSLFVMKLQGTMVDLLVSPLSYGEVLAGFMGAAVVRGILVGGVMWVVAGLFGGFQLAHPLTAVALLVLVAVVFAALGVVTAIWASTFEQVNFFPTFFITPLTFLGGVFYSIEMLPPALRRLTALNPIFYMVDGVRFGMLGISDAAPWVGAAMLALLAAISVGGAYALLRSGYKLRG